MLGFLLSPWATTRGRATHTPNGSNRIAHTTQSLSPLFYLCVHRSHAHPPIYRNALNLTFSTPSSSSSFSYSLIYFEWTHWFNPNNFDAVSSLFSITLRNPPIRQLSYNIDRSIASHRGTVTRIWCLWTILNKVIGIWWVMIISRIPNRRKRYAPCWQC